MATANKQATKINKIDAGIILTAIGALIFGILAASSAITVSLGLTISAFIISGISAMIILCKNICRPNEPLQNRPSFEPHPFGYVDRGPHASIAIENRRLSQLPTLGDIPDDFNSL